MATIVSVVCRGYCGNSFWSNIELLLNYCLRFYDRQFVTREEINHDVVKRFEQLLSDYILNKAAVEGLPTVAYFADKCCLSTGYFGTLVKVEPGRTAKDFNADLNWHDPHSRSSVEMKRDDARPGIEAPNVDVQSYDVIFIGYPIWWDVAPRAVNTFIESNDMKGKTLIPFATSGGSSITGSVAALKKAYPALKWQAGRLLNHADEKGIRAWIDSLKY